MFAHIRANLLLTVLTLLICSALYPLALLAVSHIAFREQAEGSILRRDGQAIGSSLVAQDFKGDKWFQPRPSAASFKGDASAASNFAANNPLLRDRVAQVLGPIVKYADGPKKGKLAGDDVLAWFEKEDRRVEWARMYPTLAGNWIKSDDLIKAWVQDWIKDNPKVIADWKKANPGQEYDDMKPDTAAVQFFENFCDPEQTTWPAVVERTLPDGKTEKKVEVICSCSTEEKQIEAFEKAVKAIFFDPWLQAHPEEARHLERVPADQVTQSGSGLDPDITLRNAQSQMKRVVGEWSKTKPESRVHVQVEAALAANAYRPLGGLVGGEELVNVLKLNIDVERRMKVLPDKPKGP